MKGASLPALVLALLCVPQATQAHNLIRADTSPTSWSNPLQIEHPDVSQVYYARLEPDRRQVWFRFKGNTGDRIWLQVGVPVLDRLAGFSPRAAVVGPGLPPIDVDIELPPGLGAVLFDPPAAPREFHEGFTGTSSWIWIEAAYVLPSAGTWYVVAYADAGKSSDDKLWLAVGTKERFGLCDIFRFGSIRRFVRAFHEVR